MLRTQARVACIVRREEWQAAFTHDSRIIFVDIFHCLVELLFVWILSQCLRCVLCVSALQRARLAGGSGASSSWHDAGNLQLAALWIDSLASSGSGTGGRGPANLKDLEQLVPVERAASVHIDLRPQSKCYWREIPSCGIAIN